MNDLKITGKIVSKPIYEQQAGQKVIKLTIKHIDFDVNPHMAVMIRCKWIEPPGSYWETASLNLDTLVWVEGKLRQSSSKDDDVILTKTPWCEIIKFRIIKTREDYQAMLRNADEKNHKK